MESNRLYRQHDTTADPATCRNSGLLDSSEIKLKDDHGKQGASFSEKKIFIKLNLVRSLFRACRACGVGKCDSKDCVEFKTTLAKLNPRCGNWRDLEEWAVQLAACICSQKNRAYKKDPCKLPAEFTSMISLVNRYSDEYPSKYLAENFDWADGVELSDVLGVLAWLNGITTGRYEVLQLPNELQQDRDPRQIMEAMERAKEYELCPHRVWAIAESLPGSELNLPALVPLGMHSHKVRHAEHYRCTVDFCEYSRKDFTTQKQRHECSGRNCELLPFPLQKLEEPTLAGNPTAWKLYERSIIEPNQTFMAISHVWADGTGTGPWQAGEVNECLYDFFCRIAAQFQCEGIWWDTICIPQDDKEARNEAINNLQSNYIGARITLVHDLYLREWEWVDAESACFAILMSMWFSRGWTSLELAKSSKVKVVFKLGTSGNLTIKDLDEDILAKSGEPSSPWRQVATTAMFNLRRKRIMGVNDILAALGPRDTSWPKDMGIISGLLAGVEIPIDASQHKINQRILKKINQVSQGHLFHNSATMMTKGFSWCPNSLLDIPLVLTSSTSLTMNILENGDVVGWWRVFSLEAFPLEQYIWKDTHPLIRVKIQLALKNKDKHLFLVEAEATSITRALLVKIVREKEELPRWIHCQFVGPLNFIRPQTGGMEKGVKIKARIGNVKGMGELENENAIDYVLKMAKAANPNVQDAKERKRGGAKESGENDRPDPNAEEVINILQEKVNDFNSRGKYAKTVLHMAAERGYTSAVRLLLDKNNKHDVNVRDSMGRTALLLAAANGNLAVVELLLKGEADPNLADNYEQTTPLHRAAWGGFKATVEQLLNNVANPANPRASDKLGRSALHLGAERGEEDVVQILLEKVTDVNVPRSNDGQTVLHHAAWGGSIAVVRLLLEKGVDPNTEDNFGRTALHMAAEQGHMRMVHLLLTVANGTTSKGHEAVAGLVARGTQIERKNKEGWTMMHCAAHHGQEEAVRMLTNMGANIDTKNLYECTPLRLAAENGHKAIVELLVEKQANINMQDCYGQTALHWASGTGQEAIAQLLVEKMVNVNMQDKIGSTALHLAVDAKHERIVELLVKSGANVNVTAKRTEMPLHLAAQNGHEGIAKFLVEKGANVNGKIMYGGMVALHLAAERGHKAMVSLLLEKGADLDSRSGDGQTALGLAAAMGNEAMVQLLLEKDANVHIEDWGGNTPLSLAAAWDGNTSQSFVEPESSISFRGREVVGWQLVEKGAKARWGLVRLLLEKGVNLESINEDGWTTLGLAMAWGDKGMVEPLLEKCPNLCFEDWEQLSLMPCNKRISFGGHEMVGRRLVEKGAQVEAKNKGGWTAMHYAANKGHEGFMRMLIDKGANVDTENLHNRTPLHLAAEKGCEAIVQILIEKEANIEVEDNTGWCTPLHLAAAEGHQAIVKLLIEKQTNLAAKERRWQFTPLQLAAQNGHKEIVKLLVKNGALVNRSRQADNTPLGLAVQNGHERIAQFLFESGADAKTALHLAAMRGHQTLVRFLLEKGVCVDSYNEDGQTPLMLAAAWGREAMVKLLLKKGAKYFYTNDAGNTTLSLAASEKRSSFAEHEAVGRLLLKHRRIDYEQLRLSEGTMRNHIKSWTDHEDKEGWTAMHHAAHNGHEGFVRMLIENEANVNGGAEKYGPLRFRCNPLHLAAENGHEAIVQLLVGKGAWIDAQDERHWTALCHAADIGHERIVRFLLENGARLEVVADLFRVPHVTALHCAARNGHEGIAGLLTKKSQDRGWDTNETLDVQVMDGTGTPLSWAVQYEHEAIVEVLLAKGADPNSQDRSGGRTPLSWAVQKGNEAIVKLLLLTAKRDVYAKRELPDCDGCTPLLWAVQNGNEAIVKLLLLTDLRIGRGYKRIRTLPNYPDHDKRTPLWWAVQKGNEAIVKLLLESGAKPNIKDKDGLTPLSCALEKGDEAMVELLLDKRGNLEA